MKGRRLGFLVAITVTCLVLLTVQMRGYRAAAGDLVSLVTTPIQTVVARAHRAAVGVWTGYLDWKRVRADNVRLEAENQRLRVEALRTAEIAQENRRLRRLLDLRERLPLRTVPGEVIARDVGGWVRSLTVNRGRGDDIERMTAVIAPDGLVGRVVAVRLGASIVQVLTDPASTVGAHVARTRAPGMVEGHPQGTVRFKFMARDGAAVRVGDLVVTSGQGGLFARGIPIGRVRAIDEHGSALFHYAVLAPAVDFARVDEVLLVTGEARQDLAGYFTPDG